MKPWLTQSIVTPLRNKGVRLLTKTALLFIAALALCFTFVFLVVAFFIWIYTLAGALIAALAVAGGFFLIAILALIGVFYDTLFGKKAHKRARNPAQRAAAGKTAEDATPDIGAENIRGAAITEAVQPFVEILRSLGLRREELALLAGAELAKKLPPLTLVSLLVICGFLIGRMAKLPAALWQHVAPSKGT